jgi:SAM-dependent methyltransferase
MSFDIVGCAGCDLVFVSPQPTAEELEHAYSFKAGYFINRAGIFAKPSPRFTRLTDLMNAEKDGGAVLDVGCGTGEFLFCAKLAGLVGIGLDINKDAVDAALANGLDAIQGKLGDVRYPDGSFDFIRLGDVIEHVGDPAGLLTECRRVLKEDGTLFISTPNIDSFFPRYSLFLKRTLGVEWCHPTPPYHLIEFSYSSLKGLLQKTGFRVERVEYGKIPLHYSVGATGYFEGLKIGYKQKRLGDAIWRMSPAKFLLFAVVACLFLVGYVMDRAWCCLFGGGDHMLLRCRKSTPS